MHLSAIATLPARMADVLRMTPCIHCRVDQRKRQMRIGNDVLGSDDDNNENPAGVIAACGGDVDSEGGSLGFCSCSPTVWSSLTTSGRTFELGAAGRRNRAQRCCRLARYRAANFI